MEREKWSNRLTFILAAVGSAVGLGNAWRFPGLCYKYGGGSFLLVYILAMILIGVPLLMAEIAIGRRIKRGAPGSMRALNKKAEFIGWINVSNSIFIQIYYAVVFAWVILMFVLSFKFGSMTRADASQASSLWTSSIGTTGSTTGFGTISTAVLICLAVAWGLAYYCIRNGAKSVGKVVKYTVFLPIICLVILAIRGLTLPNAMDGVKMLFIPDWSALSNSSLWVDAIGQVFYSLSVAMAIMFAYGSFLDKKSNVATDVVIIAVSDLLISVLAGVVMFTTMAGVGMLDNMSSSGIATAFIIYPQAIINLTNVGWINAIFAYVFYFCLITLSIDSLFSIVEGASTAIADKFKLNKKKTTITICGIGMVLGIIFTTGAGLALLDITDYFINSYTLILTGILEAIVIGWFFKTSKLTDEINKNTKKFKMPNFLFQASMKFFCPVILAALFIWNIYSLFAKGGIYGASDNYSLAMNIIFGWGIVIISLLSGLIVKFISHKMAKKGFVEEEITWDEVTE